MLQTAEWMPAGLSVLVHIQIAPTEDMHAGRWRDPTVDNRGLSAVVGRCAGEVWPVRLVMQSTIVLGM